jgi:tight adherence protein B
VTRDTEALLLLVVVLVLALAGIATLLAGSTRRAELVLRGGESLDDPDARRILDALDTRLKRTGSGQRLSLWLQAAGAPMAPIDLVGIVLAATVVAVLLLLLVVPLVPAIVIALGITIGGARFLGERRRRERSEAFIVQLPELARTLSNASAAGLSMAGAIQLAAREIADPAGREMRNVVQEMRLGRSLEDAMERLRERLPSRETAVLVTTIAIQQRAGGDTVHALQELSDTLEARKDLRREVRTLLSGSVFTSYLVAGLGVGTVLLLNVVSPGVLREMTTSLIGLASFAVAGLLWLIAFVLIRQTTRVDV